jgi:hypothetical protein
MTHLVRCAVALLCALCTACATLPPKIAVTTFGEVNNTNDAKLSADAGELLEIPAGIKVVAGQLPEGLELAENGEKLIVRQGYEAKYEVLGSADVNFPIDGKAQLKNMFWTWPYLEKWRRTYCPIQIPFKIITLSLWNLTPFGWPCVAAMPSDEQERKALLSETTKKAAQVMGGNLVVVAGTGDLQVTYVSQYSSSVSQFRYTRLIAYILKEKR